MCTMAAMISGDKTILLKNFGFGPTPTGWAHFQAFDGGHRHFALVTHAQQGVNSGLNDRGLGLQISRLKGEDPSPEREELRTILNGDVLARFADVPSALGHIEAFARENQGMNGSNVVLADRDHISVTEYLGGRVQSTVVEDGCLVRANHSILGLPARCNRSSLERHAAMTSFVDDIFPRLGDLDRDEVVNRCRRQLRTPPVFGPRVRSSFVIDIQERRVDYAVGDGPWRTFRFSGSCEGGALEGERT